ncbi:hypothetical protein U729_3127 (plasmid) [Clostridium baratii str. Sullivan]|uniref:Uncharacterized protein n=1 Tax=Clostridium baratii str. Sullivan TaxID=1415775 RepID=A0A0A7G2R9_9CLOT|nr:hypothetical protein [Clostridium baratii]AIY85310.1 hypothetical protein U729_3127 [Clostridium baratii str. Sullivan]
MSKEKYYTLSDSKPIKEIVAINNDGTEEKIGKCMVVHKYKEDNEDYLTIFYNCDNVNEVSTIDSVLFQFAERSGILHKVLDEVIK